MTDADMALGHLRMLALSPVTPEYLIEEIIRLADEAFGPEQPSPCRCATIDGSDCGHPSSPPYRALSPEARVKKLQRELENTKMDLIHIQAEYELAASDERLKEQGIKLEDLWGQSQNIPTNPGNS